MRARLKVRNLDSLLSLKSDPSLGRPPSGVVRSGRRESSSGSRVDGGGYIGVVRHLVSGGLVLEVVRVSTLGVLCERGQEE
jgi:hypothetical protein